MEEDIRMNPGKAPAATLEPNWNPTAKTRQKIAAGSDRLVACFAQFIEFFDQGAKGSIGPDLHFHLRAIRRCRDLGPAGACVDEAFAEHVYATLACWGMHRMGDTTTKLVDFETFRSSLASVSERVADLAHLGICGLDSESLESVTEGVGSVLDSLEVSRATSRLVASTKVLHHVLPDLVPPVDRRFTLAFFGVPELTPSSKKASAIFDVLYPEFARIAADLGSRLLDQVDPSLNGWYTSPTKVLDNAIMGAILSDEEEGSNKRPRQAG